MRVLYFGTYDRGYPRNAQVISALRGAGVEVIEHHEPVWEHRRDNWAVRWTVALRLFLDNYLSRGHNGARPIHFPYHFTGPVNTGVPSGVDDRAHA